MNDKRSKSRRRKKNPPTKEEKTIRITKQTDFVQRDEFHGAEEPMPNVTFREIKRQKKAAQKAAEREQEEQLRKEAEEAEESRSRIELTNTEDKADEEKEQRTGQAGAQPDKRAHRQIIGAAARRKVPFHVSPPSAF